LCVRLDVGLRGGGDGPTGGLRLDDVGVVARKPEGRGGELLNVDRFDNRRTAEIARAADAVGVGPVLLKDGTGENRAVLS